MPDNTLKYTRAEKLKIVKEHVDELYQIFLINKISFIFNKNLHKKTKQ